MRGGGLIELDRVGKFNSSEIKDKATEIPTSERNRRLNLLLDSLMTLWTVGSRPISSRIFSQIHSLLLSNDQTPLPLEAVSCDVKGKVDAAKLLDSLSNYSTVTAQVIIGTTGVIDSSEIKAITRDDIQVLPIAEAFARVKNYLSKL